MDGRSLPVTVDVARPDATESVFLLFFPLFLVSAGGL